MKSITVSSICSIATCYHVINIRQARIITNSTTLSSIGSVSTCVPKTQDDTLTSELPPVEEESQQWHSKGSSEDKQHPADIAKDDDRSHKRTYTHEDVKNILDKAMHHHAKDFCEFFVDSLTSKLDRCSVHVCYRKYYTLDNDIMAVYESITVQDWLDLIT